MARPASVRAGPAPAEPFEGDAFMNVVDQATRTQLQNIQTRTGKTLDELFALIRESGLTKHGQIRRCSRATSAWATATPTRSPAPT